MSIVGRSDQVMTPALEAVRKALVGLMSELAS
jgi:hypothetical protein